MTRFVGPFVCDSSRHGDTWSGLTPCVHHPCHAAPLTYWCMACVCCACTCPCPPCLQCLSSIHCDQSVIANAVRFGLHSTPSFDCSGPQNAPPTPTTTTITHPLTSVFMCVLCVLCVLCVCFPSHQCLHLQRVPCVRMPSLGPVSHSTHQTYFLHPLLGFRHPRNATLAKLLFLHRPA
jgi:hypothetical protein